MTTPLQRRIALSVLTLACMAACTLDQDSGTTADSSLASAGGFDSPRALGSLAGACPAGGIQPDTGSPGTYENELERGEYVLLTANGTVIDSIDADFGAHTVGTDSLIFIPIYTDSIGDPPHSSSIGEPVLCAAGERVLLRRFLPELDPLFSSPTIHDSTVYYWGLRPLEEPGRYFLTARLHHFPTDRVDSLALGELAMYTDDRHHLRPPRIAGDSVIYETGENRWAWAPGMVP